MTGLSASGNYVFLGSRNQNRIYYYTLPNITTRKDFTYMMGFSTTCDIAFNATDSLVWVASENTSICIKCYDTNNTMVDYIPNTMIANARGMALDPGGYLWVSDIDADKIYKIDLTEGIEEQTQDITVTPSSNPFCGAVTIQTPGLNASVVVFDMHGRQIVSDSFQESWTWNSSSPAGHYVFVITDDQGASTTLDLVKI
ncbi:hypothetical protein DRQ21_09040 [Candidatus Fermentibacteria bacterium]|nr:MAG: hypothetical protein DRQ21_09040 [Candidatus Fermentibacteria bacterium]